MASDGAGLIDVHIERDDASDIFSALTDAAPIDSLSDHLLHVESHRLSIAQSQQELRSTDELDGDIQLLEHQLDAAHQALFQMGGNVLFADEVGLGKTIEIGMVLKEMAFRDIHDTFLILTPAQLATQWRREMNEKFGLDFVCNYDDEFHGFNAHDMIVASIDTAKQDRYADEITTRQWDSLVVDEAHYLRNSGTKRYEFVSGLQYHYAFFATATPVQNDVTDLYSIVNLIQPKLFGTAATFERRYGSTDNQTSVTNATDLHRTLRTVMIRHKRDDTSIDFTDREVQTKTFEPTAAERDLYTAVTEYVKSHYSKQSGQHLVMLTLQKEVVSSPWALLGTIEKWLDGEGRAVTSRERSTLQEIAQQARTLTTPTKLERVQELIQTVNNRMEIGRCIVFTQFRATQDAIARHLSEMDTPIHVVNGSYTSKEKDQQIQHFRERGGVLVTTDAISEGRNIQFCNVLINYDLPWNPMKVEQRIGRIDRIGQDRDVYVYNLALEDTVEDYVLDKLYGKIDVFHQTVGALKEILSEREQSGASFEQDVLEQLIDADTERELENSFEDMAVDLKNDERAAKQAQQFNEDIFEGFKTGGDA
jgi:SNF2 family DNA or RNA helicase